MSLDPHLVARLSEVRPRRVLITTGAGISAESGIRTYRGEQGLWREFDFEKMATRAAFEQEPARIWQWYEERRDGVRRAQPNPAHLAVADLARRANALVITQNVDDLHERAGVPRELLVHVHGSILETRCQCCNQVTPASASDATRLCQRCGKRGLRPNVVWFDEELEPVEVARVERFLDHGPCDLVLVIGTTASFDYVREWIVRASGTEGTLVDVNPEASAVVDMLPKRGWHVRERAATALPEIARALA